MSRRVLVLASLLVFTACGGGGGVGGGGGGGLGLQSSDVPSGFTSCPQSGDIASSSDKDVQGEFSFQQKQGAKGGYISVWAASSGDCESLINAGPGAQSGRTKKLVASLILQFGDAAGAAKGLEGSFGINRGTATQNGGGSGSAEGLGASSYYLYTPQFGEAGWTKGAYMGGVVEQNISESDFKKAISATNGRIP